MTNGILPELAENAASLSQPSTASDALFASFVGPNSQKYLNTLEKMRTKDPEARKLAMTWCWPAFLITVPWLLYRKLYISAAIVALGPIALEIAFPKLSGTNMVGVFVAFAILGKSLYVQFALKKIEKLRKRAKNQEELQVLFEKAGGVSVLGAVLGSAFVICIIALRMASMDL
jgi:hypothetical protein